MIWGTSKWKKNLSSTTYSFYNIYYFLSTDYKISHVMLKRQIGSEVPAHIRHDPTSVYQTFHVQSNTIIIPTFHHYTVRSLQVANGLLLNPFQIAAIACYVNRTWCYYAKGPFYYAKTTRESFQINYNFMVNSDFNNLVGL